MGHSHKDFAGLGIAPGDVGLERLGQAFIAGLVALDYLADFLVDDDKVVIFKKNPGLKVPDLIVCKCAVLGHSYLMLTFTRFWSPSALRGLVATFTFLAGTWFAKSHACTRFARSTAMAAL